MEQLQEINKIVEILKQTTYHDLKSIEGISIGSFFKSKEEILEITTARARKARRINSVLHSTLGSLLEGHTIEIIYQWLTAEATRTNQPKQDMLDKMEELELFTELIIQVI